VPIEGFDEAVLYKKTSDISNSARGCTLLDLILRFMDKVNSGEKRWFFRPLSAYYSGHIGRITAEAKKTIKNEQLLTKKTIKEEKKKVTIAPKVSSIASPATSAKPRMITIKRNPAVSAPVVVAPTAPVVPPTAPVVPPTAPVVPPKARTVRIIRRSEPIYEELEEENKGTFSPQDLTDSDNNSVAAPVAPVAAPAPVAPAPVAPAPVAPAPFAPATPLEENIELEENNNKPLPPLVRE
jgi:hypothetical protein